MFDSRATRPLRQEVRETGGATPSLGRPPGLLAFLEYGYPEIAETPILASMARRLRWWSFVVLSSSLIPGISLAAESSTHGLKARIAFFSIGENKTRVRTIGPDRSNPRTIAENGGGGSLDWSPDGKKIVYKGRNSKNVSKVMIARADGTDNWPIAPGPLLERVSWSPTRNLIAYTQFDSGVRLVRTDGENNRVIHGDRQVGEVDWSPDGTAVAFDGEGGDDSPWPSSPPSAVFVRELTATTSQFISNDSQNVEWSPDGTRLVYECPEGVCVIDLTGMNETVVFEGLSPYLMRPTWSPDGTRVAFGSDLDGDFDIYVAQADGSGYDQLTNGPGPDLWPDWSPGGKRLAYISSRAGKPELFTMAADGSEKMRLTYNSATESIPEWRPAPK